MFCQQTAAFFFASSFLFTAYADTQFEAHVYAQNLTVPWAMEFSPDGRLFVTERGGRVLSIIDNKVKVIANIDEVRSVAESGLLGLALDPHFATNGFIYLTYSTTKNNKLINRLARYILKNKTSTLRFDRVLIDNVPASPIHDGGRLKFAKDGTLYWTIGDAGYPEYAINLKSLNGKIVRLHSDGSVPKDNPFPHSYIWSYGHRNPQGLAWHPLTNELFSTEHGPSGIFNYCCRDEVNLIKKGRNYGWDIITGAQTKPGLESPLINSGAYTTWAPSGATFVSSGKWKNSLLFVGLRGKALYRASIEKSKIKNITTYLKGTYGRLRDVIQGPDGAIYIATNNTDGRGSPNKNDDKIIRLLIK